ncbi:hypothetical protein NQ317_015641 [Molorchus minor]|uniref:DNA-directed DNA polymerase n=1 Tax=Molorchus minor TaxID=1323400 RepID=A0ABQ9JT12_9CUCU|nr:hypothetical protein NQ317_015641 [Molorchus minor]
MSFGFDPGRMQYCLCGYCTIEKKIEQIPKFEKLNNISINVYTLKLNKKAYTVVPSYVSKQKLLKHINLLMIQNKYFSDDEFNNSKNQRNCEIKYHFTWIKNLSRLVSKQLSGHQSALFICDRCLNYFYKQIQLDKHMEECMKILIHDLFFKNFKYKEPVPFIIYCDFEALLKSIDNSGNESKTERYQKHEAFAVGYFLHCNYDPSISYYKSYVGEDCVQWFMRELENIEKMVNSKLKSVIPMQYNDDANELNHIIRCHICGKSFNEDDKPVRDHCHFTGRFRGWTHSICNLNYKKNFIVPVVFHNLTGYDSHLLIKDVAQCCPGNITLLAKNKEQYISFTKHILNSPVKYRFIDSFRFLASSLDKLSSYLNMDDLNILKKEFSYLNCDSLKLLTRKGVYPYDYITSMEILEERALPSSTDFHNKLNDEDVSEDDYIHAQNVWKAFKLTNLKEYTQLYLKTDVLLLADVFENFRERCLNTYGLDPAHYYTLPGYTWDCMLKHTNVKLEFLQDVDKGIRGGVSQCCNRYTKANNKYMVNYDSNKPSNYLLYFDVNGLYAWAMSQYLPYGGFEFVDCENFDILSVPDDSPFGYILEVDLNYPNNLHDLHRDLPLCPEHRTPPNSKLSKLMTTLYDKKRYIIHYRNLKQCLNAGLRLKKIHRILKFKQSAWLKTYVDLNTSLRTNAKNEFEKKSI